MGLRSVMAMSPYVEVGVRNLYWRSPVLPNIVTRLAERRHKNGAKPPATSIKKIIAVMRQWGVKEGDLLVVHSGFRALRADGASPADILDALLEVVGPTGTLVLPAIPNWPEAPQLYDRMVADVSDLVLDYDPSTTPAWTGAVPTEMFHRPNALRSAHPLNSVAAIGPLAEAMMRDNLAGDRPFACGPTSAWNFLYRNNCKIVAMGADLAHSVTMIHLAEDIQGEDWPVRGWYRDRKFRIKVNGEFELHTVRERHPKWAMYYGERTLSRDLLNTGLCTQVSVDGVNVEMISGTEMINYLNTRNHTRYPYFLIPRKYWKQPRSVVQPRLEHRKTLPGFSALCAGPQTALLARKHSLFTYDYATDEVKPVCELPPDHGAVANGVMLSNRLLRRASRFAVMVGIEFTEGHYLVATRKAIYEINRETGSCREVRRFERGLRPLQFAHIHGIAGFADAVCYGEYIGDNPLRNPISIWSRAIGSDAWHEAYRFQAGEIEHVHAVVGDPYRQCVWILTGDYGETTGFWRATDNFATVEPVCRGHQIYRSCNCFPTPDGLVYATDSHLYPNSIRILKQTADGWNSEALHPLIGSSIYGCRVGDEFAFTTAAEAPAPGKSKVANMLDPRLGPGIVTNSVELVLGNPARGFERVLQWQIDRLPKRLFGMSTMRLPSLTGEPKRLFVTGTGVHGHDDVTEVYLSPRT